MITRINDALAESRLKREENEKGFTLIELLVVVIIIGILAAIAIPVFLNQRESAWRSSVESDLKNAALAIESYSAEKNGSLADLSSGNVEDLAGVDVKVSDGNEITVAFAGTGNKTYILTGSNDNLDESLTYNSEEGGLGDWGTTPGGADDGEG